MRMIQRWIDQKKFSIIFIIMGLLSLTACNQEVSEKRAEEDYPNRTITLLVPFPPGGGTDGLARLVAQYLEEYLGEHVVVQNLPGASGRLAEKRMLNAPHDGHTLYLNNSSFVTSPPILSPEEPIVEGLIPVAQLARSSSVFVLPNKSPYESLAQLKADLPRLKEPLFIGSCGIGTPQHWAVRLINRNNERNHHKEGDYSHGPQDFGDHFRHVPYNGCSSALLDLMRGEIDGAIITEAAALSTLQSGTIKLLAITATEPSQWLPQAPLSNAWLPESPQLDQWYGLFLPKGSDPRIIEQLESALLTMMNDSNIIEQLSYLGLTPDYQPSDHFNRRIEQEQQQFQALSKEER